VYHGIHWSADCMQGDELEKKRKAESTVVL
jgi:hypothetical protein